MNLSIQNLSKTYPNGVKAIDNLTLEIDTGMFGLLGPNGAGKSSLMRTLATLQNPDSGKVTFQGIDVLTQKMELRKVLGYLPQDFGVYPNTSARNLLDYFATLKGITSKKDKNRIIDEVLQLTNLTEVQKKSVSNYSGGMKQRFGIAQLLLNNPKLIIVDEPTAGLDPAERKRFLNVLREIGTKNTVIFSTHIVDDVNELCTELAIMNKGSILKKAKPAHALEEINGTIWGKQITKEELSLLELNHASLSSSYNNDNTLSVRIHASHKPDDSFNSLSPTLEDVYFLAMNTKI